MIRTDLKKLKVNFVCSECGGELYATLQEIADRKAITCQICGLDIQLEPDAAFESNFHKLLEKERQLEPAYEKLRDSLR